MSIRRQNTKEWKLSYFKGILSEEYFYSKFIDSVSRISIIFRQYQAHFLSFLSWIHLNITYSSLNILLHLITLDNLPEHSLTFLINISLPPSSPFSSLSRLHLNNSIPSPPPRHQMCGTFNAIRHKLVHWVRWNRQLDALERRHRNSVNCKLLQLFSKGLLIMFITPCAYQPHSLTLGES